MYWRGSMLILVASTLPALITPFLRFRGDPPNQIL